MPTLSPTLFREYDVRGVAGLDLTDDAVEVVAKALGTMVREAGGARVVVGRDCRLSGPRLGARAIAGLRAAGVDVVDLGVVPTPLTSFAAATLDVQGVCMITGSHNPPEYNGMKVAVGGATLHGDGVQRLRRVAEAGRFASGAGGLVAHDAVTPYREKVCESLRMGPRRLKVVVDAGNGTGGVVAVPLLASLGVEVVPLFVEPDGRFPNHHPDPSDEENLEALRAKVLEVRADAGIAYDGDADRVAAVDDRGNVLRGDALLILFARALLAESPGAAVVAEVKCSMSLYEDVAKRGGRAIMWKAGHSIIRAKMKEEGALLAGEMSGHIFFANRWYGFDDGIYASARLLELLSHTDAPLSTLLDDVPETFASPEVRVACPEELKLEVVRRAEAWFSARHDTVTVDGVRVTFPDGWGLVRASNTQPLLILRFEARTAARLREIDALVRGKVLDLLRDVGAEGRAP
ncbi:MAG: phosphomannomutase/phosphoglucomutase [Anaeromyxobacteraceae bacterium]